MSLGYRLASGNGIARDAGRGLATYCAAAGISGLLFLAGCVCIRYPEAAALAISLAAAVGGLVTIGLVTIKSPGNLHSSTASVEQVHTHFASHEVQAPFSSVKGRTQETDLLLQQAAKMLKDLEESPGVLSVGTMRNVPAYGFEDALRNYRDHLVRFVKERKNEADPYGAAETAGSQKRD